MEEIWKPIQGFEHLYKVSNTGKVSNNRIIMRASKINSGYVKVALSVNGAKTYRLIHRLVATAFLENPLNLREVNHKDGNKLNNHVDNLEWISSANNKIHAYAEGIREYNIPTLGKKLGKNSKYRNITYDKARNMWQATIRVNGENKYQKRFKTEEEAALHVNWIIDKLNLTDRPKNIIK